MSTPGRLAEIGTDVVAKLGSQLILNTQAVGTERARDRGRQLADRGRDLVG